MRLTLLRSLRKGVTADDGFVLPFALLLLAVTVTVTATTLYVVHSLQSRVADNESVFRAYQLAHAGVESTIAEALNGNRAVNRSGTLSDGSYTVVVRTDPSANQWMIDAQGTTLNGAKAQLNVVIDVYRREVDSWSGLP